MTDRTARRDVHLRVVPPETPEVDAIEQRQAAALDDHDGDGDDVPATIPADASEADVLDQWREVPIEDESRDR